GGPQPIDPAAADSRKSTTACRAFAPTRSASRSAHPVSITIGSWSVRWTSVATGAAVLDPRRRFGVHLPVDQAVPFTRHARTSPA
ncbi:hypothetical protein PV417_07390, partial [Streptomyces sp. ME19-03-3]|nr:hypothetical protein [Streptomyces sp. ME19-03-3]